MAPKRGGDFDGVIKLRVLRWGYYLGFSRWTLTHREKCRCHRGGLEILALETGVATPQGTLAATRSWRRHRTDPPLDPLEGAWSCQHVDFSPVILSSDSGLKSCENKLYWFSQHTVVPVGAATGNGHRRNLGYRWEGFQPSLLKPEISE